MIIGDDLSMDIIGYGDPSLTNLLIINYSTGWRSKSCFAQRERWRDMFQQ
jgi:hypothetical protein